MLAIKINPHYAYILSLVFYSHFISYTLSSLEQGPIVALWVATASYFHYFSYIFIYIYICSYIYIYTFHLSLTRAFINLF